MSAPPAAAVSQKNLTKIYCKVNKNNEVKSRVTLNKTTSLQVKLFSQNSFTSLHIYIYIYTYIYIYIYICVE